MARFHVLRDAMTGQESQVPFTAAEEAAADAAAVAADRAQALKDLAAIDAASIRAMREYIAAKPDAPQFIKDHETAAQAARARLA